ncbi:MAG: acyl-CoA dehydrogenase family protein [Acetobacteraceae bacterium]
MLPRWRKPPLRTTGRASFPFDNIERLRDAGLLGAATERCYGGREIGLSQALRIVEAVSRAEPSTGLIVAQQ